MAVEKLEVYAVSVVEREFFPNSGTVKSHRICRFASFSEKEQAQKCWEYCKQLLEHKSVSYENDSACYIRFSEGEGDYPTKTWEVSMHTIGL